MDNTQEVKIVVATFIGGVLGMFLIGVIATWQLSWIGAIVGGLAGMMLYSPKESLSLFGRLFMKVFGKIASLAARIFKYYEEYIEILFFLTVFATAAIPPLVGWAFALHACLGLEIEKAEDFFITYSLLTFALTAGPLTVIGSLLIKLFPNKEDDILIGIATFHILGGLIMGLLYNPWIVAYTAPALMSIAGFFKPLVMFIGLILAVPLMFAALRIGLRLIIVLFFDGMKACDWLVDQIVKIAILIVTDAKLLVFTSSALGAILGYWLRTPSSSSFLMGGFCGFGIAWIIMKIK